MRSGRGRQMSKATKYAVVVVILIGTVWGSISVSLWYKDVPLRRLNRLESIGNRIVTYSLEHPTERIPTLKELLDHSVISETDIRFLRDLDAIYHPIASGDSNDSPVLSIRWPPDSRAIYYRSGRVNLLHIDRKEFDK